MRTEDLTPDVLLCSHVEDARLSAKSSDAGDDDPGWIQGYAAVYGNVDEQNEIIRRGAFAKTIEERVATGKVKLMSKHLAHGGGSSDVIGTVREAREDSFGLWFHAPLSPDGDSQALRSKVVAGHVTGCSVGINPIGFGVIRVGGRKVLELTECRLREVTITPFPANELASVTASKALSCVRDRIEQVSKTKGIDLTTAALDERSEVVEAVFADMEAAKAFVQLAADFGTIGGLIESLLSGDAGPGETEDVGKATDITVLVHQASIEMRERELELTNLLEGV